MGLLGSRYWFNYQCCSVVILSVFIFSFIGVYFFELSCATSYIRWLTSIFSHTMLCSSRLVFWPDPYTSHVRVPDFASLYFFGISNSYQIKVCDLIKNFLSVLLIFHMFLLTNFFIVIQNIFKQPYILFNPRHHPALNLLQGAGTMTYHSNISIHPSCSSIH